MQPRRDEGLAFWGFWALVGVVAFLLLSTCRGEPPAMRPASRFSEAPYPPQEPSAGRHPASSRASAPTPPPMPAIQPLTPETVPGRDYPGASPLGPAGVRRKSLPEGPARRLPSSGDRFVYFRNCADARAAGAAPLRAGSPGYRRRLDGDGDGVACE